MSQRVNKNSNPSELGPWNLSETNKLIPQELKIHQQTNNSANSHASPRLTIRLPRIDHHLQHTSRQKKLALKLSHQSLQLREQQPEKNTKGRYGIMNGSFLHSHSGKDGKQRKTSRLVLQEEGSLRRRISTILVQPFYSQSRSNREAQSKHYLLNAQSAKKRSLYSLISELKSSNQLMQLYLFQRAKK